MTKFYYVYVLLSQKDHKFYIGFTSNLKRRLSEHNSGLNTSTRNRKPLDLIYCEAYLNKYDALGREKFLKSGSGHRFITKQLKHFLESIKKE